ncbi:hypothetical protein [Streptomyces sp. NRRL B-24484]|uniref:hypothetical protein n=1 Tax=Streptomyces sp. NRRL B-24484 TaxID=1463833 RepID=UPI001331552F|nr:hypothetical protein [Streptomyces sp. NRRL B-24484]
MRKWTGPTAGARAAVVAAVAAVLALAGCESPGTLHDAGPARQIAEHPSPQPLWPAAATSAPATPRAESDAPPPSPLPGLPAPAGGLVQLDARAVLLHDPALTDLEHRALSGDCTRCTVQPAQYRDLSGDGRPELITAVLTAEADGRAVLHVYGERDGKVVPVLAVGANAAFTADTVGRDLVLHEPDGPTARTSSTYRWNAVRMAFVDRQTVYTGPADGAAGCPTPEPTVPAARPTPTPTRPGGVVIGPDGRPLGRSAAPSPVPTLPTRQR